jgi:very-short-patch-repair endonuclease
VIVHRSRLPRVHVGRVERFRVTTAARTILDLGAVVSRSIVERAMDGALHRRLTSLDKLQEVLEVAGGPGRAGTATLRALLFGRDPRSAPPESLLEARLAKVLAASSLPAPVPQHPVREGSRLVARLDFAWPDHLVALEADGYRHHGSAAAWARDVSRDNRLVARGWRVLHVTWEDVMKRPEQVVRSVAAALRT